MLVSEKITLLKRLLKVIEHSSLRDDIEFDLRNVLNTTENICIGSHYSKIYHALLHENVNSVFYKKMSALLCLHRNLKHDLHLLQKNERHTLELDLQKLECLSIFNTSTAKKIHALIYLIEH